MIIFGGLGVGRFGLRPGLGRGLVLGLILILVLGLILTLGLILVLGLETIK